MYWFMGLRGFIIYRLQVNEEGVFGGSKCGGMCVLTEGLRRRKF